MHRIHAFFNILVLAFAFFATTHGYAKRYEFNQHKIGGDFRLIFYAPDNFEAADIAEMAYALVDSLDLVLSNYKKHSEVSRLNAHKMLNNPSTYFLEVLKHSQMAYHSTEGYFDISILPLMMVWDRAAEKGKLPKKSHLQKMKKHIGFEEVLHLTANNALLLNKAAALDVGGIAKGYIIDQVYELLIENDAPAFLIEAAGDIRVFGKPEEATSWTVGVSANQYAVVSVTLQSGEAIATSGKTYRYRIIDGERYSHIINPKTLRPVRHNITSSVVSSTATEADFLASAFNIITDEHKREEVLRKHPHAQLLLLANREIIFQSDLFPIKTHAK